MAKRLAAPPDAPRRISQQSWFRKHAAKPRADWHEVKLDLMRSADWAKFSQNPDLGALLLATGTAELIEDSPSEAFWGSGRDGAGQNWAGRVLMEVRERLRQRQLNKAQVNEAQAAPATSCSTAAGSSALATASSIRSSQMNSSCCFTCSGISS